MQVAVFPFVDFAVIVAVPSFFAVTTPLEDTIATFLLEDDHVMLSALLEGVFTAESFTVFPLASVLDDGETFRPVKG